MIEITKEPISFFEKELEEIWEQNERRLEAGGGDRAYLTAQLADKIPHLLEYQGELAEKLYETEERLKTSWSSGYENGKKVATELAWQEGYLRGKVLCKRILHSIKSRAVIPNGEELLWCNICKGMNKGTGEEGVEGYEGHSSDCPLHRALHPTGELQRE